MKLIIGTFVSLASLFMLYLCLAIFSAPSFEVVRQKEYLHPKQTVWHKFSRFKNWESWTPWKRQDFNIRYIYSGKPGRKGAKVSWIGSEIGKGSMTVTDIIPFRELNYRIHWSDWDSKTKGNIKLHETNSGTSVVWTISETLSFWMRPFGALGFFDSQMGNDLELGLEEIANQFSSN